jgi:hypothetical protein
MTGELPELRELLEMRAERIVARPDALGTVLGAVRRRRRRRRTAGAMAVGLIVVGCGILASPLDPANAPPPQLGALETTVNANQFDGSPQALALRTQLHITGATKGASDEILVRRDGSSGSVSMTLVHASTGSATPMPPADQGASVSPDGGTVAAISERHVVVMQAEASKPATSPDVVPGTSAQADAISWTGQGSAFVARVDGRWVHVSPTVKANHLAVRRLSIPDQAGPTALVSVSPAGDLALLFGVRHAGHEKKTLEPHLFLGHFDGTSVTGLHRVAIPATALAGPMGWIGDNAFLVAPGPGKALILRTDGTRVHVGAQDVPDACALASAGDCRSEGPDLLGTNRDGSLLYWRTAAVAIAAMGSPSPLADSHRTEGLLLIRFYASWLDGSHVARLTGPAAKFGPPLAPR